MAMLIDIDHNGPLPAEDEVSCASPQSHRYTQVYIVCHEDKHQEVADHHL